MPISRPAKAVAAIYSFTATITEPACGLPWGEFLNLGEFFFKKYFFSGRARALLVRALVQCTGTACIRITGIGERGGMFQIS